MKKLLSLVLAVVFAVSVFAFAAAAGDEDRVITVTLNGEKIEFDVQPCLINDRTMVPIRFVAESLKAVVGWDDPTQTVTMTKGDTVLKLQIGDNKLYKNDEVIELDSPAVLKDDRTLVPVRAISESFDVKVGWDDATSTVMLSTGTAVTLTADTFKPNNGFFFGENKTSINADEEHRSVPKVELDEEGVKVTHKGYYQTGANCGGVYSAEAYTLDGLTVTVKFDKVPAVDENTDCWIALDFLAKPGAFFTNNFDLKNGGNQGVMDLIRFSRGTLELYEGVEKFAGVHSVKDDAFAIKSGDVVTVSAKKLGESQLYRLTFTNGDKTVEIDYDLDMSYVFDEGKAHIAVIGSCELEAAGDFVYHITSIANN